MVVTTMYAPSAVNCADTITGCSSYIVAD
jgi:hypothetical protein